jgi:hypothetical protein
MKLGDFRIHYLNGGITHIDGGAMFGVVPKALSFTSYFLVHNALGTTPNIAPPSM